MIDLHAHILPGLDDGPRDLDEAVRMCRAAAEDGTRVMVASPHMLNGVYDVAREDVFDAIPRLQGAVNESGAPVKILPGADVHLHADLPDLARRGAVVTLADAGVHLLVEMPPDAVPGFVPEMLFSLQLAGLTPIITHPERNAEIQGNRDVLRPMIERGVLVQVTAASLTGGFGSAALDCARDLVTRRMAHFVASDAHSATGRPPGLSRARRVVEDLTGSDYARRVFEEWPEKVVSGQRFGVPDPTDAASPVRKSFWMNWWR